MASSSTKFRLVALPPSPKETFNNKREISDLLKQQVQNAHDALVEWIGKVGRTVPSWVDTEQEAADYVAMVARLLHPEGRPRELRHLDGPHFDPLSKKWQRRVHPKKSTGTRRKLRPSLVKGKARR